MKIVLKKGEENRIIGGSLWIYGNEVLKIEGYKKDGDITDVYSFNGTLLGRGYINTNSKILVRLLTNKDEIIDENFFYQRIKKAYDYRINLGYENNFRMIFSEADFLPGLVVDKYGDILVCQFSTLGMDIRKKLIVDILNKVCSPKGIYNRSDLPIRKKEGLLEEKGFLLNEFDTKVLIDENDIKLYVDIENGQKTGYFLDQKENRLALRKYVNGKNVLDCFSHTGSFALNAIKGNAKKCLAIDISSKAVENIQINAKLNGMQNLDTKVCDVFNYLRECQNNKITYDVIILDPPAFTKTKDKINEAYRGYKEINLTALKIIKSGGFLVTCSCSEYMSPSLFLEMLQDAIVDSKRNVRMVEFRIQAPDHPMLISDNSLYLKFVVLNVL